MPDQPLAPPPSNGSPTPETLASIVNAPEAVPAGPLELPADTGYELHEEIGHGGMGVIYRAYERTLDRDLAVKLLRVEYRPESSAGRRFLEEARMTGRLQHPGIPPVHHVGTLADGRPFLAMKLI